MAAYASAPSEGLQRNIETVRSTIAKHGYALSAADLQRIAFVHEIFNRGGPSITAEMFSPGSPGGVPVTYTDLMTATDRNGQAWSYLSTEAAYQYIREMHRKNLIIPLVGNFAGPKTIRRVSEYLKQRNQTVAAFYLIERGVLPGGAGYEGLPRECGDFADRFIQHADPMGSQTGYPFCTLVQNRHGGCRHDTHADLRVG